MSLRNFPHYRHGPASCWERWWGRWIGQSLPQPQLQLPTTQYSPSTPVGWTEAKSRIIDRTRLHRTDFSLLYLLEWQCFIISCRDLGQIATIEDKRDGQPKNTLRCCGLMTSSYALSSHPFNFFGTLTFDT